MFVLTVNYPRYMKNEMEEIVVGLMQSGVIRTNFLRTFVTVEMYLMSRCFTSSNPKQWVKWFPWVEYCYNARFHSATKRTPFEIIYGRAPILLRYFHMFLVQPKMLM